MSRQMSAQLVPRQAVVASMTNPGVIKCVDKGGFFFHACKDSDDVRRKQPCRRLSEEG